MLAEPTVVERRLQFLLPGQGRRVSIRIGLVGAGFMGGRHAEALRTHRLVTAVVAAAAGDGVVDVPAPAGAAR